MFFARRLKGYIVFGKESMLQVESMYTVSFHVKFGKVVSYFFPNTKLTNRKTDMARSADADREHIYFMESGGMKGYKNNRAIIILPLIIRSLW